MLFRDLPSKSVKIDIEIAVNEGTEEGDVLPETVDRIGGKLVVGCSRIGTNRSVVEICNLAYDPSIEGHRVTERRNIR